MTDISGPHLGFSPRSLTYVTFYAGRATVKVNWRTQTIYRLWGMYKRSEPMGRLHSVQKHMANVYLPLQFKEVEIFREHTM